jgi:hypothetical protein
MNVKGGLSREGSMRRGGGKENMFRGKEDQSMLYTHTHGESIMKSKRCLKI